MILADQMPGKHELYPLGLLRPRPRQLDPLGERLGRIGNPEVSGAMRSSDTREGLDSAEARLSPLNAKTQGDTIAETSHAIRRDGVHRHMPRDDLLRGVPGKVLIG